MPPVPDDHELRTGWSGPLADKRGPDIHPCDTLVDLGLWWVPTLFVVAGLVMVAVDHVRPAIVVMAVGAVIAAVARSVAPERAAGGLVTRSRVVDVLMWLVTAGLLWMMSRLIEL
ncbi:DUF3017 domain-containing protein [Kytococcus sp. Marseille-QA3725]